METTPVALADRLLSIPVFSDLSAADREWVAFRREGGSYKPGDMVIAEDSPADRMIVVLEGEAFAQREHGPSDGRTFSARAGNVTGLLPYSRLTTFPITSRALTPATVAYLHSSHFPAMLERLPALGARLVGLMSDRIRERSPVDQAHDKLRALGKLSAGLAHELNNPAAAVRNAAVNLKQAVAQLRSTGLALQKCELSADDRTLLARLECDWASNHPPVALDSLERSDREEDIGTWLESHGIANARSLAHGLVDAGCDMETLRGLAARFDDRILTHVVTRLAASFTVGSLVEQIESGTSRISELVRAIKQY